VGQGTTFHVLFPQKTPTAAKDRPRTADAAQHPEGTERLLFVDDEPALIDAGQEMLASLGYRVTACTSSEEALNHFKANPERFDLVITDLNMPGMTGDRLAQEIMRLRPVTPVILFTGYSDRVSRKRFIEMGIQDCLMKPLTRKDLAASIRRILDRPSVTVANNTNTN
jgi:CheY-like chemotaxis protein